MRSITKLRKLAVVLAACCTPAVLAQSSGVGESIAGRWDATLTTQGTVIPFRLDITGSGSALKGVFFDGFHPNDSTSSATFLNGKLVLNIDQYLTTIAATLKDGKLEGILVNRRGLSADEIATAEARGVATRFQATRHVDKPAGPVDAPSIAGTWIIPLDNPSAKGEQAFRFFVEQRGAEVAAAILRADGDTGAYTGAYQDGKWVLSHFDGGRPGLIVVTLKPDNTLEIVQDVARAATATSATRAGQPRQRNAAGAAADKQDAAAAGGDNAEAPVSGRYAAILTAYRPDVAQAKGLPEPADFTTHTRIRDPNEIFTFNFPDTSGKLVSNEDPRFKGKVVLAIVTGTWCPNCHDEAQYLVQLDKKYRDQGLQIVALDFEEPEQQNTLERVAAFTKHYGIKYPYLIAGAPAEMWEKVPQAVHLNCWPTTVFIGRDGKVKAFHSGFASPASGVFYRELQEEFTTRIEKLLAESAPPSAGPLTSSRD